MAFFGALYWLLPGEFESELVGVSEILFWAFCAAVAIVSVVFMALSSFEWVTGPGESRFAAYLVTK